MKAEHRRLYLAQPPLYRLSQGGQVLYARDDRHKEELLAEEFKGRGKVHMDRFKGLGEMSAKQLKETTMSPQTRTLLRVAIADREDPDPKAEQKRSSKTVERLMGRRPELRFRFIQENARFVETEQLDV